MTKRPLSFYTKTIMDVLKVDEREAHLVENMMRSSNGGVLDSLTSEEFNDEAQIAKGALDSDSELKDLIGQEVFGKQWNTFGSFQDRGSKGPFKI